MNSNLSEINLKELNIKNILINQITNLVNDMLIVFPNDKLFILCKNNFDLLKNNKDEKLFEVSYINYLNFNKFSVIMNKLKTNWKKLDTVNKNKVWEYFNLFIILLDKLN